MCNVRSCYECPRQKTCNACMDTCGMFYYKSKMTFLDKVKDFIVDLFN